MKKIFVWGVFLLLIGAILFGGYLYVARNGLGVLRRYLPTAISSLVPGDEVSGTAVVLLTQDGFVPATLTVERSTAVTFTNRDTRPHQVASDPHPTHTALPDLDSDVLASGDSFLYIFDKVGTFTYHDHLAPTKLKGTIVVTQ